MEWQIILLAIKHNFTNYKSQIRLKKNFKFPFFIILTKQLNKK